jgi:beta-lactamase class A
MRKDLKQSIKFLIAGLLVGSILTWGFGNNFPIARKIIEEASKSNSSDLREINSKYKFIKPLLTSEQIDEDLKWFPAERKTKAELEAEIKKHPDVKVGMHFINLNNGGWFGINGSESFIPASLLKLPLYASYLKLREDGKVRFDEVINYAGSDFDKQQNLGTGKIQPGNSYTVDELLTTMIVDSDNNALELLYQYKQDSLKDIFEDLQIELPVNREEIAMNDFVTPRGMARFLMVLYNASYLNREDSEEALELLSKTNFQDGIVAGVPAGINISHKFGEREVAGSGGVRELHDCGIVYHEKTPYLLCVMTKGKDFNQQKEVIKKISEIVYSQVSSFAVSMRK